MADIFQTTFSSPFSWMKTFEFQLIFHWIFSWGSTDRKPALLQIMAWCPAGHKPLSEPMMVSLLTHICVTRPQGVKLYVKSIPSILLMINSAHIQSQFQTSNIRCTKSQHLNVSRLVFQLSWPNPSKQRFKREWRCSWGSNDRRCSNYIWVINNVIAYWGVTYIRGLTVHFMVALRSCIDAKKIDEELITMMVFAVKLYCILDS